MRTISIAALLLLPALAWAEPKTAEEWYKEGENQYNLQNFEKAVEAFKQGFALETNETKKAAYLFNVAQSYRQANDCKNAYFYYKRFLSLKDNDPGRPLSATMRKQVEDRIAELEQCAQQAQSISKRPPNSNLPPDGGEKTATPPPTDTGSSRKEPRKVATTQPAGDGDGDEDDGGSVSAVAAPGQPHKISLRLIGGGTKVSAGDNPVPVQATFAVIGGYPIPINPKLTVEAGAALTFTPVPYDVPRMAGKTGTGQLWGLLANAGVTYEVMPKLGVRADLGVGALFFAGAGNSPFTDGAETSGALSMFHIRAGVSADYAITPNVVVTAAPFVFTYSPPKAGLVDDIKSITSIDFMIGVGYRK